MKYEHLKLWESASNYGGADFSDYYVVHTIHRDSNLLDNHNHDYIWRKLHDFLYEDLGREIEVNPDWLIRPSFNHWAVGWVECIMVHENADESLLNLANDLLGNLDDYPILDEDSYSERVWKEMEKCWNEMSLWERVKMCGENNVNIFSARHDSFPEELDEYLMQVIEE